MDDDGDDKDDTKRRTRNLSEKKRRDQFNMLVNELSAMVSTSNRKMDKSTVLKSTISFLKNHNEVTVRSRAHDVQEDWKPQFLSNEEFTYLVLEALEGFVMVFSATGQIYYVSESIASLLGHNPAEIVNTTIFELAYEQDKPKLFNLLQNPSTALDPTQSISTDNEIKFQCHLQRGTLDFRDEVTYELVHFNGHFRANLKQIEGDLYQQDSDSRVLFVCTGKLNTPQLIRDVSLVDSSRSEFTSRHSLEWKFLFLDHRAPPIIGYLPFEVLGTSGYDYYHFDDLDKVVTCHEALMQKGELTSCYYRFLTKGQQWIWLQTRFYITYHQWNSKPEFVMCTHRVVSYSDILKCTKQESGEAEVSNMNDTNHTVMKANTENTIPPVSPAFMSEASEAYGNSFLSHNTSQPASVKSATASSASGAMASTANTASTSWSRTQYSGYDNTMVSAESRSSNRSSSIDNKDVKTRMENTQAEANFGQGNRVSMFPQQPKIIESPEEPQHGMGAQFLDSAPYARTVSVPAVMPAVMPTVLPAVVPMALPTLPVVVTSDQAQRKHEELQEMIMRQQEELRQVKEQLLLARLGILQPIINVHNVYTTPEDLQPLPAQMYDRSPTRNPQLYPPHHQGLGGNNTDQNQQHHPNE
ncbi:circadian locomoter output cycles protein kaput isoform X2 [Leptidea sinapis]|uniref:circadian locomoter output cycles protein kaput isoform X2 n=1 Tax=Leptidea sinapis TaxID=189913 RepID=UPI0021C46FD7|nr:circadian locomoter output cycles protein kaput isoform X2 [Leptidea sinapis]